MGGGIPIRRSSVEIISSLVFDYSAITLATACRARVDLEPDYHQNQWGLRDELFSNYFEDLLALKQLSPGWRSYSHVNNFKFWGSIHICGTTGVLMDAVQKRKNLVIKRK